MTCQDAALQLRDTSAELTRELGGHAIELRHRLLPEHRSERPPEREDGHRHELLALGRARHPGRMRHLPAGGSGKPVALSVHGLQRGRRPPAPATSQNRHRKDCDCLFALAEAG